MSTRTDTTTTTPPSRPAPLGSGRAVRAAIWVPGLAVALGAAVATAHGLFETAVAARVPPAIAWLYPLITDGLALVAYTATARLRGSGARYAWSVVILAAGLSGLAQAAYLTADSYNDVDTPAGLRFGVGAWPAIAAAIVAHLLYLLATATDTDTDTDTPAIAAIDDTGPPVGPAAHVQPELFSRPAVQPSVHSGRSAVHPGSPLDGTKTAHGVQPSTRSDGLEHRIEHHPAPLLDQVEHPAPPPVDGSARERARAAVGRHAARHGALPTVTELEALAGVSRGTAAAVLKALRAHPTPLHLITNTDHNDNDDHEEHTQP